jgi:GntR family transcriptional regulator
MVVDGGGETRYAKRRRIREHVLDLVEQHAAGEAIPPERLLAEELGVSRPTLRAVVEELVRDGLLEKHHGKGVFVSPAKVAQHLSGSVDGAWTSRVLDFEPGEPAGPRIGRRLRRAPADPVVRITRLRLVDGDPMSIEQLYVPADLVPGLTAGDLAGHSFHGVLVGMYGVEPAAASQSIEPTVVDTAEAELLGVPAHTPALLFERVTTDADGRVIEFCRAVYRGDRYRIQSELILSAQPAGVLVTGSSWSAAEGAERLALNPYDPA